MPSIQEQVIANAQAIAQILEQRKNINEFNDIGNQIDSDCEFLLYSPALLNTYKSNINNLVNLLNSNLGQDIFAVKLIDETINENPGLNQIEIQIDIVDDMTAILFDSVYTNYLINIKILHDLGYKIYYNIFNRTQKSYFSVIVLDFYFSNISETNMIVDVENLVEDGLYSLGDNLQFFINIELPGATLGVDSFNGRDGIVVLELTDITSILREEHLKGTALYSATTTGTVDLDCDTFADWYRILTGNTDFTFSNTPASGATFVRSLTIKSTASETLSFSTATMVIGEYVNDTSENDIQIKFSNFPTVGLKITVYINQE